MKNWLAKNTITKNIDGEEVKFRRIPIGILQKFRFLADDASKALALLFKDTSKDVKFEQTTQGEASNYMQEAANPSIIQLRKVQTEEGISALLKAFTSDEAMDLLMEVIRASANEEDWPESNDEMKNGLPPTIMIEMLKGAFEASAGDYEKLGKSLFRKIPGAQDALENLEMKIPSED